MALSIDTEMSSESSKGDDVDERVRDAGGLREEREDEEGGAAGGGEGSSWNTTAVLSPMTVDFGEEDGDTRDVEEEEEVEEGGGEREERGEGELMEGVVFVGRDGERRRGGERSSLTSSTLLIPGRPG